MENNSQSDIFLSEEANSWFMRNKKVLKHGYELSSIQFIKRTLRPFRNEINSILEIGCSNAIKLETLVDDFAAKGYFNCVFSGKQ